MTGVSEAPVIVMDWVWHNAMRYLDPTPAFRDNGPESSLPTNWDYYPRQLVLATVDYLSEDLGCDHQVNICMCGIVEVVKELNLNLAGSKSCPSCGGEAFEYDHATYEAAKAKQLAEWGGQELWDIGDSAGFVPCVFCNGKGTVPTEDHRQVCRRPASRKAKTDA